MPAYGTPPLGLSAGYASVLWNDETVAANGCSVCISMRRNPNLPNYYSIELSFAANPGTFSVEVQTADTDQDKFYVSKTPAISTVSGAFVSRTEMTSISKYMRLKLVSLTNAVKVTAKVF